MTFLRSIAVLTAVCLCVAFAYFFGYGLPAMTSAPAVRRAGLVSWPAPAMLWPMGRPGRAGAR
jgi:uncharacterized membrane protein (DUF441 family)